MLDILFKINTLISKAEGRGGATVHLGDLDNFCEEKLLNRSSYCLIVSAES